MHDQSGPYKHGDTAGRFAADRDVKENGWIALGLRRGCFLLSLQHGQRQQAKKQLLECAILRKKSELSPSVGHRNRKVYGNTRAEKAAVEGSSRGQQ